MLPRRLMLLIALSMNVLIACGQQQEDQGSQLLPYEGLPQPLRARGDNLCLQCNDLATVALRPCDGQHSSQRWIVQNHGKDSALLSFGGTQLCLRTPGPRLPLSLSPCDDGDDAQRFLRQGDHFMRSPCGTWLLRAHPEGVDSHLLRAYTKDELSPGAQALE